MADQPNQPADQPLSEEELRAAYEEQLKRIRVEDVVIQTIVSLLNLGGRKSGLAPGSEAERDPEQLRQAIEAVRALMPLVEDALGPDAKQLREVLSQLQMAYARQAEGAAGPGEPGPPAQPGEGGGQAPAPNEGGQEESKGPGPAQSSGRLWVPGQ
jgi:Tetratrico peptide repeat